MLLLTSAAAATAWSLMLLFRGGFWRADQRLPPDRRPESAASDAVMVAWPAVAIIIPARNEAAAIGASVAAHMRADYPEPFETILVDDQSDDGTAALAFEAAGGRPLTVLTAPPLAAGWTGKLWALRHGIDAAMKITPAPKYLLLADADIALAPATLRRLVEQAEAQHLGLASLMSRLDARGAWGGLLIPAFVFFFQKLYPFAWVNDPRRRTAAAAGGCALVNAQCLAAAGGVEAIRGQLIDDCSLAALIKNGAPRRGIWLGLSDQEAVSLRDNREFGSIWSMVARTAFDQLNRSWLMLAGAIGGMFVLYLAPPLIALGFPAHGDARAATIALTAYGLMTAAYWPTTRTYGPHPAFALTLPIAAALYMAMTVASGIAHARGRGGRWKGRNYSR